MAANLFANRGGRRCGAGHVPADSEGLALATALVMYFSRQTDNTHPQFYDVIAQETKRARGTLQIWSKEEIKQYIQEKLWKKIPGEKLSVYFQKMLHGLEGDARMTKQADLVGEAMCPASVAFDHVCGVPFLRAAPRRRPCRRT